MKRKRKFILYFLSIIFLGYAEKISASNPFLKKGNFSEVGVNPPFEFNLDPGFTVNQNINQSGLVLISGSLTKPFTTDHVKLSIKYQDSSGNWITGWCKILYSYNQYNENLVAKFELPASTNNSYNLKIDLSSNSNITNWSMINWNKDVKHYKSGDYSTVNCDLDENEYTILLTPKKNGTLNLNANNKVTSVKDRVTSIHSWNKLSNVLMNNKKDNVLFTLKNPANLVSEPNGIKALSIVNQGIITDTIAATPDFIYNEMPGHPIPYLHSYDDPIFIFAGKFSVSGFLIKFSQYPLDPNGSGYHDFKNPNALQSRYFNTYNTIYEKLSDFIVDQEPVVFVSSVTTGFRVYKSNGTYINLTGYSNYGGLFFGYGNDQAGGRRGPGSENFKISNTNEMTLYGMGALRNNITPSSQTVRSLQDIEIEIKKFIKYTGIFSSSSAYNDNSECAIGCFEVNAGAKPDDTLIDWTKAPNSYIFTGKDKNGNNVDGLYIPVKKAYDMWKKGGDLMKDDTGNYTQIPSGSETAGIYWEDELGLIKSAVLEGTGESAKIKVLVNKTKKGNAVISYRVNGTIYWTWHVWATDDPTNGSTYHYGFEKDKEGNLISNWKWMDRNLGATNKDFVGNNWNKSGGLQYQWGRKDPYPSNYKDLSNFEIRGEVGTIKGTLPTKYRGNLYSANNTGFDSANGNVRYSINNPINYIIPPMYIYKIGETPNSNGESYYIQGPEARTWERKELTTWFSKSKYKYYDANNYQNNIVWDLWGDPRGGSWTNKNTSITTVAEQSVRYALKSPYDPCPCGWRIPSFYSSVDAGTKTSPWGNNNDDLNPTTPNATFPGIKVYPGLGFNFENVSSKNLGIMPINGNYEFYPVPGTLGNGTSINRDANKLYINPSVVFQDQNSDGGLHASTFFSTIEAGVTPVSGARGLLLVSDAANVPNHTTLGFHKIASNRYLEGNTYESRGVRCIADPNNSYMPTQFETEFVSATSSQYTIEQLRSWTKDPNTYIEYTNAGLTPSNPADKDLIIDLPLRKGYAMYKLNLSNNDSFPTGSIKSSSVVWTTNTSLISSTQIIDGTEADAKIRVTLNPNQTGNAVIAFHLGSSGQFNSGVNNDPIIWSWHIWVPKSVIQEYPKFSTETYANSGIKQDNSGQFVDPVNSYYGVPLSTTLMDRDLGAQLPFLNQHFQADALQNFQYNPGNPTSTSSTRVETIRSSGGLHYQWGRKDPIPVFYYPGGYFEHSSGGTIRDNYRKYFVYRQTGYNTNGTISYGTVNEATYLSTYTKDYASYSAGINSNDSQYDKIKTILRYSVNNPMTLLYQSTTGTATDWISDQNGLLQERWGHATEKSPYDPCPAGWRIPDLHKISNSGINLFDGYLGYAKGNSPWFYNAKFKILQNNGTNVDFYGIDPAVSSSSATNATLKYPGPQVNFEEYNVNLGVYIGGYVRSIGTGRPNVRYGFVLNKSLYNIGNFPNNGIRGLRGGNTLESTMISYGNTDSNFYKSGIWTSSPIGTNGRAAGMLFNVEGGGLSPTKIYFLTPSYDFYPQAAMSCRCAKIEYDANGNEIGRYNPDVIAVPQNTTGKAANMFNAKQVQAIINDESKVRIFPNPVKNKLFINANDKDYFYQIYNASGQLVKKGKFENRETDLTNLPTGVYILRINDAETVVKIVKQ